MTTNDPPLLVRQAALSFPDDAPRGAVKKFCAEHDVSQSWFYKVRQRAREEGVEAARLPRPRTPHTTQGRVSERIEQIALQVRQELKDDGWDYGPISVWDKMTERGLNPPSRATLARIFTRNGVVKPQPKKRPRSSYTSFSYPEPNGSWQLDGTEYELPTSTWVILQVEDDHSRKILASSSAPSETGDAAIEVVDKAIARYGVPQHFHTDNGFAFNRDRWGVTTRLAAHLRSLGITPITGKPYKPTTQGKQERLHQTVQRFLDAHQPIPDKARLDELLDEFEDYYNTMRPHQAHTPRRTPDQVYYATPKAAPPTPPDAPAAAPPSPTVAVERTVKEHSRIHVAGCTIYLGVEYQDQTVYVIYNDTTISVFDIHTGELIGETPRLAPINKRAARITLKPRHYKNRPRTPETSNETQLSTNT